MENHIRPRKCCHVDLSTAHSLRKQTIKKAKFIPSIDLRHISQSHYKTHTRKLLKQAKFVKSITLSTSLQHKHHDIISTISRKQGLQQITIFTLPTPNRILNLPDPHAEFWFPNPPIQPNHGGWTTNPAFTPFSNHSFPKTLTSLKLHLNSHSNRIFSQFSKSIKPLQYLRELEIEHPRPFQTFTKIELKHFEDIFNRKTRLQSLRFNALFTGRSIANFDEYLNRCPLKRIVISETLSTGLTFNLGDFKNFLVSQPQLEEIHLKIVEFNRNDHPQTISKMANAIAERPNITKFTLEIDASFTLPLDDALALKEVFKTKFKQLKLVGLQFNENYLNTSTNEENDLVLFEASKLTQAEQAFFYLKSTQKQDFKVRMMKTLFNNVFTYTKLRELRIRTKIELHETALLYLLWNIRNLANLNILQVKTILPSVEMEPLPDIQKMPQFTGPKNIKTLALEWTTDFGFTDKVFEFIGLQKDLEHLNLGILRTNNPTVKDWSKNIKGLASLQRLKSLHFLSVSPSFFKPPCFDAFSSIVKGAARLDTIGITFLDPYMPTANTQEKLQVNPKCIELGAEVIRLAETVTLKETMRNVYFNFKVKSENLKAVQQYIGAFAQTRNLRTLAVALEAFIKRSLETDEGAFINALREEVLKLGGLKTLFIIVEKSDFDHQKLREIKSTILQGLQDLEALRTTSSSLPLFIAENTDLPFN